MGARPRTGRREKMTPVDPLVGTICCHPLPSRQNSSSCSRRVSWDMAGTPFRQLMLSLAIMGVSAPGNRFLRSGELKFNLHGVVWEIVHDLHLMMF
jgi:hypothetical protein